MAFYNNYFEELGKGNIDYSTDSFKIMLMTDSYTQDTDTEAFRADLSNEVTGTNYTAGGTALSTVTITQDDTNDRANVDCVDVTFSNVTISDVNGAVVYKDTGNSATDILVGYYSLGSSISVSANDLTLTINASGLLTIA